MILINVYFYVKSFKRLKGEGDWGGGIEEGGWQLKGNGYFFRKVRFGLFLVRNKERFVFLSSI